MPLVVEHLTRNVKLPRESPGGYDAVEREWGVSELDAIKTLVEEDGGPNIVASFYGSGRSAPVEHVFTRDYSLAGVEVRKGDLVRAARRR